MESRNIWNVASHAIRNVHWLGIEKETEWRHIGEGASFETERAQKIINEHFPGQMLYLVIGRHDSKAVPKAEAVENVAHALVEQNIVLCNERFCSFAEFSCIGSYRLGTKSI